MSSGSGIPTEGLASSEPRGGRRVGEASLWFGGLGAPAAWSAHFLFTVAYGPSSCTEAGHALAQFSGPWWVIFAATVLMLGVAAIATIVSARNLYRLGTSLRGTSQALEKPGARPVFMAFGGLLLGAMFLVGLAFSTVALFLVPLCV